MFDTEENAKLCQLVHPTNIMVSIVCDELCFVFFSLQWRNALLRVTKTNCVLRAKIKLFQQLLKTIFMVL